MQARRHEPHPSNQPLPAPGSLVDRTLAWDVVGTRRVLQAGEFTPDDLQGAIFLCVLFATAGPCSHALHPYNMLVQQLAWSYKHLPGPSPQHLQVLQELVQHVNPTAYQGVDPTTQGMAAASGCAPLLWALLEQPQCVATAALEPTWESTPAFEPPQLQHVSSRSHPRLTMVVPQSVRWPGQIQAPEGKADFKCPGVLEMAAASGNVEAVRAVMEVGWPSHGAAGGYEAANPYAGLEPIHWAAAVSWAAGACNSICLLWCLLTASGLNAWLAHGGGTPKQ
jgi:hypothetical protein